MGYVLSGEELDGAGSFVDKKHERSLLEEIRVLVEGSKDSVACTVAVAVAVWRSAHASAQDTFGLLS